MGTNVGYYGSDMPEVGASIIERTSTRMLSPTNGAIVYLILHRQLVVTLHNLPSDFLEGVEVGIVIHARSCNSTCSTRRIVEPRWVGPNGQPQLVSPTCLEPD